MASPATTHPSDQDWESHRDILERLYSSENKSMREVMSYMEREYGWKVKKNQYEKWLITKWVLRKNVDSLRWKALYPHIRDIERQGKRAQVWIDGKEKPEATVEKETRRQLKSCPDLSNALPSELPKGVIVREVSSTAMPLITTGLPFHSFESCIHRRLPIIIDYDHSTLSSLVARASSTNTSIWSCKGAVEEALQPVVPQSQSVDESFDRSIMGPDTQTFTHPLVRSIMFSIANNFAGLGAFSQEEVIDSLQHETREVLYRTIRTTPHHYTTQAIAINLFRASIGLGDAKIVNFLVSESLPGIEVNQFISTHSGIKQTPLERAVDLRHKDVVKVLLDHGADVNLSHPNIPFGHRGALHYAVAHVKSAPLSSQRAGELDRQLIEMLLKAGGEPDVPILERLSKQDENGELVRSIVSTHAAKRQQEWSERGIFHTIFKYQDHATMLEILSIMLRHRADLDCYVLDMYDDRGSGTVIDVVAERGDLTLVKLLLKENAHLTGDTLPCAISSGNLDLIRLLLAHGAKPDSIGSLRISPLAAAIWLQLPEVIDLIFSRLDSTSLSDDKYFRSTLEAASGVGDVELTTHLVKRNGNFRPNDLGTALRVAAREGREDIALAMIDAGADTNPPLGSRHPYRYSRDGPARRADDPALLEALRQRRPVLVSALLNADADPNYGSTSALELAVRWGDIDIVKAIIRAGDGIHKSDVGENTPYGNPPYGNTLALNTAVGCKDRVMINLLLEAGCNINSYGNSALEAAVKTRDIDIVCYILSQGADPHDLSALAESTKQDSTILDLLLREHAHRYPKGRPGWGTQILRSTISSDNFPLFKKLLDGHADANHDDGSAVDFPTEFTFRTTIFGYAVSKPHGTGIKFVEVLLQQGARTRCDPETIVSATYGGVGDNVGRVKVTAFLAAIGSGNTSIVELLLRYGADVDFPAELGVKRTPLQMAVERGNMKLIHLLLARGADVNGAAAQRGGGTALQLAALEGFIPITFLLLKRGADVDAPASKVNGRTALEGSAWQGRLDMVALLLKAGAARGGSNKGQLTRARAFAEENSHNHIVRLLSDYALNGTLCDGQAACGEIFDFDKYECE